MASQQNFKLRTINFFSLVFGLDDSELTVILNLRFLLLSPHHKIYIAIPLTAELHSLSLLNF